MKKRVLLQLLLLAICSLELAAQSKPRQLSSALVSKEGIDTVSVKGSDAKVILHADGSWSYHNEEKNEMELMAVFNDHWNPNTLFSYKDIALSDLPNEIEIEAASNLSHFHMPILTGRITSRYGMRRSRHHNGIDIGAPQGTPLYATFDGRIRCAMYHSGGYGNIVIIRHTNGLESWYGHMCRIIVSAGEYVKSGQIIGYLGNTGRSTGPHLHYELRYKDQVFDPSFIIDFDNKNLRYTRFTLEKSFFNIYSRASEVLDEEDVDFATSSELFDGATDNAKLTSAAGVDKDGVALSESKYVLYHTIRSGDTLGKIATKYGTTIGRICELNKIKRTTVLQLNRKLRVR